MSKIIKNISRKETRRRDESVSGTDLYLAGKMGYKPEWLYNSTERTGMTTLLSTLGDDGVGHVRCSLKECNGLTY